MVNNHSAGNSRPEDRASYLQEFVIRDFARREIIRGADQNFHASMRAGSVGSVGIFEHECDPCLIESPRRSATLRTNDDFILAVLIEGRAEFAQGDRHLKMGRGTLALLEGQRPLTVVHHAKYRGLTVSIPRRALEARLSNAASLSAFAIPASKPLAGLTFGFLQMLPDRARELNEHASAQVGDQVIDLVALTLSQDLDSRSVALSTPRAMTLLRLKSVIEGRLSEPELRPAVAAAAAGVSVRYANALLAEEGYSIERYILERRLERCRRSLEDPKQARRMIGEIAFGWGFSDLSHFGRRFRAAYGVSPGDYRRRYQEEIQATRLAAV